MSENINHQHANISRGSITSKVTSSILKEKCNRTRVLYAGPGKQENTLTVYRLAEIFRGRYYLEETVYDVENKSINSTLSSVKYHKFHKKFNPEEYHHAIKFESPEITGVLSYTRTLGENKLFRHSLFVDERRFKSILAPFTDLFLRSRLFSYVNKN